MNIYEFNGVTFTEDQVIQKASSKGVSLEQYLNENPEVRLTEGKAQGSTEDPTMSQIKHGLVEV